MKQRTPNIGYRDEKSLVTLFGCTPLAFSGSRGKYEDGDCIHFRVQTKHTNGSLTCDRQTLTSLRKHAKAVHKIPVLLTELVSPENTMVGKRDILVSIPLENLDEFVDTYRQHRETCAKIGGGT